MSLGKIIGIDASKGTIDQDGQSSIRFTKSDNPSLDWSVENLRGKRCSFFASVDDKGRSTARSVTLI